MTPAARSDSAQGARLRSWATVAAVPSAVFLLDAFLLNQGAFAVVVALVVVALNVPLAVHALVKRRRQALADSARRVLLYPAVAAAVFALNGAQNQHARRAAGEVIAACEAYREATGGFPESLEELTPRFLPRVPRAKFVLAFGDFDYHAADGRGPGARHTLTYVALPPFGRPTYLLEERRWTYLD